MPATIGAPDLAVFTSGRHERLLRAITGIQGVEKGLHVFLEPLGVVSAQRLAVGDLGGNPVVALWPAEMKEQAMHLYGQRLARPMIKAARANGWKATATPHLAFRNAGPAVRLYMNTSIDAAEYAARWEGGDLDQVGAHAPADVRRSLWPWLKERGYVRDADDSMLSEWLSSYLGNRDAFMRAGFSLKRECGPDPDPEALRREVDAILTAAGDPMLPATRPR